MQYICKTKTALPRKAMERIFTARRLCYLARPMKNAWRRFVAIEIGKNNSFVVF